MVDTKTVIQTVADHKGDDDIFAYQASDDSMELAADVERLGAVTLAFCSGLDTCRPESRPKRAFSLTEHLRGETKGETKMNVTEYHETSHARERDMNPANVAAVAELLSRVEALLQRPTDVRETVLSVGSLQLDLVTRTVSRNGRTINLLPREFRLLAYLMRRQGQLVTRAMLFREVWKYKFVPESNLVDVHIGRLRRKIDRSEKAPMIYSIRGQGFVLHAPANTHPTREITTDA